jgi:hypothetical protein
MQYLDWRVGLVFLCSKTPWRWQSDAETCWNYILAMNCVVLGAVFGWFVHCKNMHRMSNTNLLVWYEARSFITPETGPNSEADESSSYPRYLKFCTNLLLPWTLHDTPMILFCFLSLRYRTLRCGSRMSSNIPAGDMSPVLRQGICEAVSLTLYPVLLHALCNYIFDMET